MKTSNLGLTNVEVLYNIVEGIRSVETMRKSLDVLRSPMREELIAYGLVHSPFQYTWSWLASIYGVDATLHPHKRACL